VIVSFVACKEKDALEIENAIEEVIHGNFDDNCPPTRIVETSLSQSHLKPNNAVEQSHDCAVIAPIFRHCLNHPIQPSR
jgi:hypothetical protein